MTQTVTDYLDQVLADATRIAKENETDLNDSAFEQAVRAIAKPQPAKPKNEKDERDNHTE